MHRLGLHCDGLPASQPVSQPITLFCSFCQEEDTYLGCNVGLDRPTKRYVLATCDEMDRCKQCGISLYHHLICSISGGVYAGPSHIVPFFTDRLDLPECAICPLAVCSCCNTTFPCFRYSPPIGIVSNYGQGDFVLIKEWLTSNNCRHCPKCNEENKTTSFTCPHKAKINGFQSSLSSLHPRHGSSKGQA